MVERESGAIGDVFWRLNRQDMVAAGSENVGEEGGSVMPQVSGCHTRQVMMPFTLMEYSGKMRWKLPPRLPRKTS